MISELATEFPVMLVDAETAVLNFYEQQLNAAGIRSLIKCSTLAEARAALKTHPIELLVLEVAMEGAGGIEFLRQTLKEYAEVPIIVVSSRQDIELVIDCIRLGVVDYLPKPLNTENWLRRIRDTLVLRDLRRKNSLLRQQLLQGSVNERPKAFAPIVTRDPRMFELFEYCMAIASYNQPVLITGETGTGKELFARALHELSGRSGELVAINIAGMDDNLMSDNLFGHVKGAYTGALSSRPGAVEKAQGSTLLIDEIGDMSLPSQVKLLRLLQQHEYSPLGTDEVKISSARIVLSTLRNLSELQRDERFRRDLYYRIAAHTIHVPPLRERLDDLPLLLDCFIRRICSELGRKCPAYTDELLLLLRGYSFPGNVRELEGMVIDAVSRCAGRTLPLQPFLEQMKRNTASENAGGLVGPVAEVEDFLQALPALPTIKEMTQKLVAESLRRSSNNQSLAAKQLGITPQALSSRLRKNGEK
ncbi:sigma-54 dependent transcriptional regulator [Victivallis sp. Marseille-Q1083]|uniref:sigma-54-dependent transcriptional regulator n=1 Tax=Victivallis sp. Marseille-Q1083 TaxID=2717288 RepID=UPI00158B329E|nr:sigma-54 dependent transcriptional regulator [Victivallis sp. Marseille-Q1083]